MAADRLQERSTDSHQRQVSERVYVVVLNWNGWKDTIECLESVFRLAYPDYRVIVCDNGSTDGSVEHIKAWAEGRLDAPIPADSLLRHLSFPPVPKPIDYVEYDRDQAGNGGSRQEDPPLVLVQTGANLGFAGGNNVGLRYALARSDFGYVWLLNNDTAVEADALTEMIRHLSDKPGAGMCGATLLYYANPDRVQALGGARYSKWFGVSRHIGVFQPADRPAKTARVERQMDYVHGACMLVRKKFLQDVGLMSEDYFLCSEEIDWAIRGRGRYSLAFAPDAIVYHKEGSSLGSSSEPRVKSLLADYYAVRGRLRIARKFLPWSFPTVYLGLLISAANRARRGQWDRAWMVLKIILGEECVPQ